MEVLLGASQKVPASLQAIAKQLEQQKIKSHVELAKKFKENPE
jgi:hypothetical protein